MVYLYRLGVGVTTNAYALAMLLHIWNDLGLTPHRCNYPIIPTAEAWSSATTSTYGPFHCIHDLILQAVDACCNMRTNSTHNSLALILHWLSLCQHRNIECVFVWWVRQCLRLTALFFTLPFHLQPSISAHTVKFSYPSSFQLHSFQVQKELLWTDEGKRVYLCAWELGFYTLIFNAILLY